MGIEGGNQGGGASSNLAPMENKKRTGQDMGRLALKMVKCNEELSNITSVLADMIDEGLSIQIVYYSRWEYSKIARYTNGCDYAECGEGYRLFASESDAKLFCDAFGNSAVFYSTHIKELSILSVSEAQVSLLHRMLDEENYMQTCISEAKALAERARPHIGAPHYTFSGGNCYPATGIVFLSEEAIKEFFSRLKGALKTAGCKIPFCYVKKTLRISGNPIRVNEIVTVDNVYTRERGDDLIKCFVKRVMQ